MTTSFEEEHNRILDSAVDKTVYCCPERRRLYVDCRYGLLHIEYDSHLITILGTFEAEEWEDTKPFQMEYCMFCGAKL